MVTNSLRQATSSSEIERLWESTREFFCPTHLLPEIQLIVSISCCSTPRRLLRRPQLSDGLYALLLCSTAEYYCHVSLCHTQILG
jgi:hypothetical protein